MFPEYSNRQFAQLFGSVAIIKKNASTTIKNPATNGIRISKTSKALASCCVLPGESIGAELKKLNPINKKKINIKTIIAPFK